MDEKEEARLLRWFHEVEAEEDAIDCESDSEVDSIENDSGNTDTEQDAEISDDESTPTRARKVPSFIGKDCKTLWRKHVTKKNVRTRKCNIVTKLPGVKAQAKNAVTITECWNLFFLQKYWK